MSGPIIHQGADLFLAADQTTIVPDGDPAAAFLLVRGGCVVPAEHLEPYRAFTGDTPAPVPVDEAPDEPPADDPGEPSAPPESSDDEEPAPEKPEGKPVAKRTRARKRSAA